MARIRINDLELEYELMGRPGAPAVALTPGGRYSMETPGYRELAEALGAAGRRVLIWDRPNCGASDLTFEGDSESGVQGRTLAALIEELDLGRTALAGGSAGSRVSIIAATAAPDLVSHMVLWWISGGAISLVSLAWHYYCEAAHLVGLGGMEAVADSKTWADQIKRNPRARQQLLSQDPAKFLAVMERWSKRFSAPDDSPIPGMTPADFAKLKMPILVFRSGKSDVAHPRRISEWVHDLIPQSKIVDPPWPDEEWNNRRRDVATGAAPGLFVNWPKLAPTILDFLKTG